MKNYDVKYEIGQEIYIILNKTIIKSSIKKIRIIHDIDYIDGKTLEKMSGITIEYLVITKEETYPSGGCSQAFDWHFQDEIYLDKDELFRKIA